MLLLFWVNIGSKIQRQRIYRRWGKKNYIVSNLLFFKKTACGCTVPCSFGQSSFIQDYTDLSTRDTNAKEVCEGAGGNADGWFNNQDRLTTKIGALGKAGKQSWASRRKGSNDGWRLWKKADANELNANEKNQNRKWWMWRWKENKERR